MLIAHAPAGYLLTQFLSRTVFKNLVKPKRSNRPYRMFMAAGILGGIFPDIDLIYMLFNKSSLTSHHAYITHLPLFWLAIWLPAFLIGQWKRNHLFTATVTIFCASAMLHLCLDTITGVVFWFAPFYNAGINFFKVADVHLWWVQNFTNHWTFIIELFIIAVAMARFLRVIEVLNDMANAFRKNRKFKATSVRIGICAIGLCLVIIAGSYKFGLSHRIVHRVKQLKHYVLVRMPFVS
jgi:hypothetical protein